MSTDAKGSDVPNDLGIDATTAERVDTNDIESTKPALEETARVVDHQAEESLCRKFDYRLLPVLALMCRLKTVKLIASRPLIPVSRSVQCS